jgi:ATP-dependent protease ClpP protease subunit
MSNTNNELYIHNWLESENGDGIDYKVAISFIASLHALEQDNQQDSVIIHMMTPGGEWGDGMAMYDAIEYSSLETSIIGHGYLSSMGTVLLQSVENRYLMPSCDLMVHFGQLGLCGHQVAVESTTKYYQNITDVMLNIYASRCVDGPFFVEKDYTFSKTKAYIKRKLESKVDWYLTAEEAVHYGFADKVLSKEEYIDVRKINKTSNIGTE